MAETNARRSRGIMGCRFQILRRFPAERGEKQVAHYESVMSDGLNADIVMVLETRRRPVLLVVGNGSAQASGLRVQ